MKKVVNAGIGGRNFTIEEDAYNRLDSYLKAFRSKADSGNSTTEVMDEVEARICELFSSKVYSPNEVITLTIVNDIISQLGMPDGSESGFEAEGSATTAEKQTTAKKKFYRDSDNKYIGGVCSGLGAYFDIDIMLIRIIFIIALFVGTAGFWAYIILWAVAPIAKTSAQKCELRGLQVTAENMAKYPSSK